MQTPAQTSEAPPAPADPLLDRFDIKYLFKKYFRFLIIVPILTTVASLAYYSIQPSLFASKALIYVDPNFDQIIQYEQLGGVNLPDADSLSSLEIAMMSESMILRVVERLGLLEEKGFLPNDLANEENLPDLKLIGFLKENRFKAKLIKGTRLIEIKALDPNAERAQRIAGAFATEFELFLTEQRQEEAKRSRVLLDAQARDARKNALSAETSLRDFRKSHPDFPVEQDHDLFSERLSQFNQDLNAATRERLELEVQQSALADIDPERSPITVIELSGYQKMQHVSDLMSQRTEAHGKLAAIANQWGESHPNYKAAVSAAKSADLQLRELATEIKSAIQSKHEASKAREANLKKELAGLQSGLVDMKTASSEFRALQQQVEREWMIHETLQQRLSSSSLEAELATNISTAVSNPMLPYEKAQPVLLLHLIVGVGSGCFLACVWIGWGILRGLPYTHKTQLEQRLNLPVVANWSKSSPPPDLNESAPFVNSLGLQYFRVSQILAPGLNGLCDTISTHAATAAAHYGTKSCLVRLKHQPPSHNLLLHPSQSGRPNLYIWEVAIESVMQPNAMTQWLPQLRNDYGAVFLELADTEDAALHQWLSDYVDQNLVVVGPEQQSKIEIDEKIRPLTAPGRPALSLLMIDPVLF